MKIKNISLVSLVALLLVFVGLWQLSKARKFQVFGRIVASVPREDRVVALTFDDGPTAAYTEAVLSVLKEKNVTATFFVTGKEVEENLDQAARIVAHDHQLGNHSYSHPRMVFVSPGYVRNEIERTDAAIRRAGFIGDILFRPPFGKKLFVLPWYLEKNGRTTVTWDVEPETDREIASDPQKIADHVLANVKPGSIILLHVMYKSGDPSRAALPLIIDGLRQKGYRFLTVSDLIDSASL